MACSVPPAIHREECLLVHQETMAELSGEPEILDAEKRAGIEGSDL